MLCTEKYFKNYRTEEAARFYLKRYFSSTEAPEEVYLSQRYVDLCINTDVLSGTTKAYGAMAGQERFKDSKENAHSIGKDVRVVIKILDRMSRVVPQELSMGMLLSHLEILEDLQIA
jgi:hypothetical protein